VASGTEVVWKTRRRSSSSSRVPTPCSAARHICLRPPCCWRWTAYGVRRSLDAHGCLVAPLC